MANRILVVDAAVEGLARIQAQLQPQGHAYTWALTAEEALETIGHEEPDVILIDAGLPDGQAKDLVTSLRKSEAQHIPILLAVQKDDQEQREWAHKAPVDEVLEKPFETAALTVAVRQLARLKAVRRELELRKRELAGVSDAQRGFIEALVHDLKNPIAVVHVNLSWISDRISAEQPDLAESISDAQEGIDRVQKIVEDMLIVGMLEKSQLPLKRELIRVTELLDQAIKSHEKEAVARRVSLSVSSREPVGVVGDPNLLRRIVNNMVESSLRHTPSSGRIELSARAGDSVEIAISNTGRPLDAEERAQLLDPPPASGSQHIASGGLGLYFCRRAVEAHDGQVDIVESDEWPTSLILRFPSTGT